MDADGDGYGTDDENWTNTTPGSDCDDYDPNTYPGAGYNELYPINEACITDDDGDGYGTIIDGYYEDMISAGDCYDISITSAVGIGCTGSADMYVDGVLQANINGPTAGSRSTERWCTPSSGLLQVGWTEPYNPWPPRQCGIEIADSNANILYSFVGTSNNSLSSRIPPGGTDIDDSNAQLH